MEALNEAARAALYDLSARSTHPKSEAIAALMSEGTLRDGVTVHEETGCGMQALIDGTLYRLGRADWAAPEHEAPGDVVFAANGQPLASFTTHESLRPGAADEIRALEAMGYEVWILSGDHQDKVNKLARELDIPIGRAVGQRTPEGKADWLREHDAERDTLFIGDGINDTLAASAAMISGTPSIDRPFMPARCDFYFITAGLRPIRLMLQDASRLQRVVWADLTLALTYNLVAVALAYAGLVEPWLAAILMPLSSLSTIALTTASLREGRSWRS